MPSPSSDKAPSSLFSHLPRLTHQLICSQFPANISHLTQTFPPGCYLCCCQYVPDTNEVTLCGFRLSSPPCVNQKLLMDSTQHRYRSLVGGGGGAAERRRYISSRNTRIDLCVPEPTVVWLTGNTIKWKREATEDHHYINHHSFPRLPSSIICAHDLMSFVCSETNFTVSLPIIYSRFTAAQSQEDRNPK